MHFHVFEMAGKDQCHLFHRIMMQKNLTFAIIQKFVIQIFLLSKHMPEVSWICNEYIMLTLSAYISAVKLLIR